LCVQLEAAMQLPGVALGPAANGTGEMARGGGPIASWKHEFLEGRQVRIQCVELVLETGDGLRADADVAGKRQFCADLEELVLDAQQGRSHRRRKVGLGQYHCDDATRFVD